jgi:hypothetical protein
VKQLRGRMRSEQDKNGALASAFIQHAAKKLRCGLGDKDTPAPALSPSSNWSNGPASILNSDVLIFSVAFLTDDGPASISKCISITKAEDSCQQFHVYSPINFESFIALKSSSKT